MANHDAKACLARPLAPLVLAALAACGAPPPPPPPPAVAPVAVQAPARTTPPALGLLAGEPEPVVAELSDGEVSAFAGRFERLTLPPGVPALAAVDGLRAGDVWMLTKAGRVLQWDGARAADRGAPRCLTDQCCGTLIDCAKKPSMCTKAAIDNCQPVLGNCVSVVEWDGLRVTPEDVLVSALVNTGGLRSSLVEARLGKGGRWSCEQAGGDLVHPGSRGRGDGPHALELSIDGVAMRLEGPAVLVNVLGGYILVVDGRRVPLPGVMQHTGGEIGVDVGLAARSPADLWLWRAQSGEVWRGNGLSWSPFYPGFETISRLWLGESGSLWMLGATEKQEGSEELRRWDLDKGGGQRFATPGAAQMVQAGGQSFWLLGKSDFYAWDGRALRHAEAPLEFADAWRSPTGEIWVVGADPKATVKAPGGIVPAAAAFRLPVLGAAPAPQPAQEAKQ